MSKPYTLIGLLEAKESKIDELKSELTALLEPIKTDALALEFKLHQDCNNPAQFVLYEIWPNQETHQLHAERPYIQSLLARLNDLIAKEPQLIIAEEIQMDAS